MVVAEKFPPIQNSSVFEVELHLRHVRVTVTQWPLQRRQDFHCTTNCHESGSSENLFYHPTDIFSESMNHTMNSPQIVFARRKPLEVVWSHYSIPDRARTGDCLLFVHFTLISTYEFAPQAWCKRKKTISIARETHSRFHICISWTCYTCADDDR